MRKAINSVMVVSSFMAAGVTIWNGHYILSLPMIWIAFGALQYGKRNNQHINIRNQIVKIMSDKWSYCVAGSCFLISCIVMKADISHIVFSLFLLSSASVLLFSVHDGKTKNLQYSR